MKKLRNLYICVFALLIFGMCSSVRALGIDNSKVSLNSESSSTAYIGDNIIKKEVISTIRYEYSGGLKENPYTYISVNYLITYLNEKTGMAIAMSSVQSNFRCNALTREAKCLSVSRGNISNDDSYTLNVFARKANRSTERGASCIVVKFKHKGIAQEEFFCNITCDYLGNIGVNPEW